MITRPVIELLWLLISTFILVSLKKKNKKEVETQRRRLSFYVLIFSLFFTPSREMSFHFFRWRETFLSTQYADHKKKLLSCRVVSCRLVSSRTVTRRTAVSRSALHSTSKSTSSSLHWHTLSPPN